MTHTLQRSDAELADAVRADLRGLPSLAGTQIFVTVEQGAVTLYGRAAHHLQAQLAEKVVLGVPGVVAVAQEMFISTPSQSTDSDIARQAAQALSRRGDVPDTVKATVQSRVLTLSGEVTWQYQRSAACRAVKDIIGVNTLVNAMTVGTHLVARALAADIAAALTAQARDPQEIEISVSADSRGVVTVSGTVGSEGARLRAEEMCWAVPGVTDVGDRLVVLNPL